MLEDFQHLPEPSFDEKWGDLQKRIGRHPSHKDQWGRDAEGSDSDNGVSDSMMEELVHRDRVEWKRRMRRNEEYSRQGKRDLEKATESKPKRKKERSSTMQQEDQRKNDQRKPQTDPSILPLPPRQPRKKQPLAFETEEIAHQMQVDNLPAPTNDSSVRNSPSKKHGIVVEPSPPPPHLSRTVSPPPVAISAHEILELSSESEGGVPAKKQKRSSKSTVSTSSKGLATGSSSTAPRASTKGRTKARLSMEQAIEEAQKIKVDELKTRFADISSFVDHLSSFELDRPMKLLQGCRVLFVNADHWKASRTTRNRLDQGLRLELGIVARQGGTLIKPEDFVPSPPEANKVEMTDQEIESRAEEEGWTTHIIGFHPSSQRPPTFNEALSCLGRGEEGITVDDLGPFVKVVTFSWVSQCVKERKKQSEWEFAIKGDPREAPSSRVSSNKSSPTKKSTSAKDRRQGRRKKGPEDEEADTSGESLGEEDEEHLKSAISQDYPSGEQPPKVDRGSSPLGDYDNSKSRRVSSRVGASNPLEGLEEQSKLVKELGDEEVDDLLHDEFMIYTTGGQDDCQTQQEEEALENGEELVEPDLREKRKDRVGYAVNRKHVLAGPEGPNDATAYVLLQLSEFHKGDPWRERGYRLAAGALRACKHKITDYKELVKIPKIGPQIAEKIIEIQKTGTHRKLMNELPEDKAARLFSGIYGIGLALGHELAKRGAKTIEDLWKEEYYSTLTLDQQVGLKYYNDLLERIPRAEVTELYNIVLEAAREVDPKLQVECMGSYRRGQPTSGDIDILVTRDPTQDGKTHSGAIGKMYKILKSKRFFQHILSQSDDWSDLSCKVNGLCRLPGGKMRRIDILGVPWPDIPAALIYFTGNDHFNRSLRLKARHMGYSLNQKCLSKCILRGKGGEKLTEGTRIEVKSEKDIFRILGVPYKRPEERIPS
ncbi:hypothetical protein JCM3765_003343 [Sporobolomyces pararoseus]